MVPRYAKYHCDCAKAEIEGYDEESSFSDSDLEELMNIANWRLV